jgi:quercetin dioxygenase-like cupin family protein
MSEEVVFSSAGSGRLQNVLGMLQRVRVEPSDGDMAFLMIELSVAPGCGAPMHTHEIDSECFYLLEGSLTFIDAAGTPRTARVGDVCFLPPRRPHAFRNDGETPARALVIASPGREAVEFFDEIDTTIGSGVPEFETVSSIAERHKLRILPPPSA